MNSSQRVLIVDDEKVIAITLGRIFSGKGYEVRTAYSAEEALVLLSDGHRSWRFWMYRCRA